MRISRKYITITAISVLSVLLVACEKNKQSSASLNHGKVDEAEVISELVIATLLSEDERVSFNEHIQPISQSPAIIAMDQMLVAVSLVVH